MISVLYFSDRTVRQQLFDKVSSAKKPLLIAGVRHGKGMRAPQLREPFHFIEDRFGSEVDQLLVADDGTIEGMWRDPLGDLGDALFPNDRAKAYAVSSGYVLLRGRQVLGMTKKHGSAQADRYRLLELLSAHLSGVPRPDPSERAKVADEPTNPRGRRIEDEDTNPRARRPMPTGGQKSDAWAVLGIAPGTAKDEAKKAFRALIAQYHPDKVSHLAPEFKELAERRTREILAAWDEIEKSYG